MVSESERRDIDAISEGDLLALTAWGEARGERDDGVLGVVWTILNRVKTDIGNDNKPDWWGEGIRGVCLKPRQYSCWNEGDPNREKILALPDSNARLNQIRAIVADARDGRLHDPTGGATHYHTKDVRPSWADKLALTTIIGRHWFYREGPPVAVA